jgi:hypothetical protein
MVRTVLLLALLAVPGAARAQPHWDIQYRYRQVDSTLTINDLAFPSEKRGIACGYTTDRKDKDKPLVLVTSDGGEHWSETPVKETGTSLFFLDDSKGWMITGKGIWTTDEAGRTWIKLKGAPTALLKLWFLDRQHGFAVGLQKRVFETHDGGDSWAPLPILQSVQGDAVYTTFGEVSFSGDKGIISGWNLPPRRGGPDWMEPERAGLRKQLPHYSVLLQTVDGGKTWLKSDASIFGEVTRISLSPQGTGLGLIQFKDIFEFPSEVMRINIRNGKSVSTFRAKDRAITDVRVFKDSPMALIAGYEPSGPIYNSPIPGKVKVLTSTDSDTWTEMTVDYRAVAHTTILAGPDERHMWLATDTGMILRLVP